MAAEYGTEFAVHDYDEDVRDDLEASYRGLDLVNYPTDGDTAQGNDVILAAYREGVEPGRSFESVMVVGTDRSGFHEREWQCLLHQEGQSDYPRLDDMRLAMAYAGEIGRPYDSPFVEMSRAFYRLTEEGQARDALFDAKLRESLIKYGGGWSLTRCIPI